MSSTNAMDSVLEEARKAVSIERNAAYGSPEVNHERTAEAWAWYISRKCVETTEGGFRVNITGRDVCWLNVLQKLSRDIHGVGRDNAVDVIGYAANAHACHQAAVESGK